MDFGIDLIYIYFLLINILGYYIMGKDKRKAQRNEYRIKESTLWNIALVGGSIGAYLGMKVFRHKTKHKSFVYGFPLLVIVHSVLFIWLYQMS